MPPGKPAHWRVYACFFTVGVAGVGGGTAGSDTPSPPSDLMQGQSILVTRGSSGECGCQRGKPAPECRLSLNAKEKGHASVRLVRCSSQAYEDAVRSKPPTLLGGAAAASSQHNWGAQAHGG